MRAKKKKNKEDSFQPKTSSIRLEHDPIPSALTPLKEFNYSPDEDTYDALRFLASWYNSDQYAGMEHDRGRNNSIPGRHMLQTAYGRSRMGNRDTPYERAMRIAYSPRFRSEASLDYDTAGAWDPAEGTVSIAGQRLFDQAAQDRDSAVVHELYHAAEGASTKGSSYGEFGRAVTDQRFHWPLDQRAIGLKDPYEGIGEMSDAEIERMTQLRKGLKASNPYSEEDWRGFINSLVNSNQMNSDVGFSSYVNSPSEVTARLREAAFKAQQLGYLGEGDFKLNDEILENIKSKSSAARDLLDYSTPEQRQFYYNNL